MNKSDRLLEFAKEMSDEFDSIKFRFQGTIYNPLDYAWDNFSAFMRMSVRDGQKALMLGMNPGPLGMVQTGVPFGSVDYVKSYLEIDGKVSVPENNNLNRPIEGMDEKRNEVSGERFWSMAKMFGSKDDFFDRVCVLNYCPLGFIDENGANVTPDRLHIDDQREISRVCDGFLKKSLEIMDIESRIGIGNYAFRKLSEFGDAILFTHPSPRNPKSRLFWPEKAYEELRKIVG